VAIPGLGEVAEQLRRSTVLIHAGGSGSGSGIIWSTEGIIVTNAHVARGSRLGVQLWDGRELKARIMSRNPRRDIALLRVNATDLPAAAVGDSSEVRPGELAIAIGNPLGFIGALATGTIHTTGHLRGLGPYPWIQANLRLAPGNSGGPLANAHGRIIGINTMVAGRLALAIPSNAVQDLLSSGPSDSWFGVTVHPVRVPQAVGRGSAFGLVVLEIEPASPAANASLLPGDILLGADEKSFASLDDLAAALQGSGPRVLRLAFLRGDYERFRRVTVQLSAQRISRSAAAA
jgi:serine protease Do